MKTQIATELADLIHGLMSNDDNCDMSIIESDIMSAMNVRGLSFMPYLTAFDYVYDQHIMSSFDTTADYFFDAINCVGITKGKIENLINACIA